MTCCNHFILVVFVCPFFVSKCLQVNPLLWEYWVRVRVMVFNTTFNNISVISWQSVLLVEETGISGENHQPVASHWQTLSHKVYLAWTGFELTTSVVIGTDCTGSCKSNYYTITTTTAHGMFMRWPSLKIYVFIWLCWIYHNLAVIVEAGEYKLHMLLYYFLVGLILFYVTALLKLCCFIYQWWTGDMRIFYI